MTFIQTISKTKKQTVDAASIIWENQQKIIAFEMLILDKIHAIKQV
jgi:hypothetical protein